MIFLRILKLCKLTEDVLKYNDPINSYTEGILMKILIVIKSKMT